MTTQKNLGSPDQHTKKANFAVELNGKDTPLNFEFTRGDLMEMEFGALATAQDVKQFLLKGLPKKDQRENISQHLNEAGNETLGMMLLIDSGLEAFLSKNKNNVLEAKQDFEQEHRKIHFEFEGANSLNFIFSPFTTDKILQALRNPSIAQKTASVQNSLAGSVDNEEEWVALIQDPNNLTLVAEVGGQLIDFLSVNKAKPKITKMVS